MKEFKNNIWFRKEGDNWFKRNKEYLGKKQDIVSSVLELYKIKPKKIVEIGCSNGYRLANLHKKYGAEVTGIEPSREAIEYGKSKWPFIKFKRAMCESFVLRKKVDLVIINFVFHWIMRENLMQSTARIDEIVKDNGFLVIGDFGTENFIKRDYHHLPGENVFTYKQEYQDIFLSTGLYKEIAKIRFDHDTGEIKWDINYTNMGTVSLLRKCELYIQDRK